MFFYSNCKCQSTAKALILKAEHEVTEGRIYWRLWYLTILFSNFLQRIELNLYMRYTAISINVVGVIGDR